MNKLPDGVELLNQHTCFGGLQLFYRHASTEINLPMRFSVYLPPQALAGAICPGIFFLAGLTCNEETFMIKAGAQRVAALLGVIIVTPDTSPRDAHIAGDSNAWDLGVGAGFYLDATAAPWRAHYRMESYIVHELRQLLTRIIPIDLNRLGIMGHSMGGHGALTLALRHPGVFKSLSALAPIAAPIQSPWGQKAFNAYLGADLAVWSEHDATELMLKQQQSPYPQGILIDQGEADQFLATQLHPHLFAKACNDVGQPLTLRHHAQYDHGYFFVSSVIEDHLRHHNNQLSI